MGGVSTAVSRLGEDDSRESQNLRAVKWLLAQDGGQVVVVTPRRAIESECLARLTSHPAVRHHAWRGHSGGFYDGQRVLYAWPDRQRLNEIWNVDADAIAVIEWSTEETAEWIGDINPIQLYPGRTVEPTHGHQAVLDPLPNGVDAILEHVAAMAAGYSSGLKWNEEDQLKADMMNRPDRWADVTVERAHEVQTARHAGQRRRHHLRVRAAAQARPSVQRAVDLPNLRVQLNECRPCVPRPTASAQPASLGPGHSG